MATKLLGFPTTMGLPRKALRHCPEAIRATDLFKRLSDSGHLVEDLGDLSLVEGRLEDPVQDRVRKVIDAARMQANHWRSVHKPGDLMVTLGGDHSTSLGTIWALSQLGQPFDIVWVDAHGDFNILETSPSGNPHGMVLSLACGLLPEFLPALVAPDTLHLWGVRELDAGERRLLERERVEVLSPDQVRADWSNLLRRLKPNVFLSFDIDSVDPEGAPGTMTPVPGGFTRGEALDLVSLIARNRKLLAVDLVEFHPDQDRSDITLELAVSVLFTALDEQAKWACERGSTVSAGK